MNYELRIEITKKEYTAICTFYVQITNGRSSIFNKQTKGVRLQALGYRRQATGIRLQVTGYRRQVFIPDARCLVPNACKKETPFRLVALKGDEMFRSIWENGERGTPEQWRN